jgi:hypothetical protein
LTRNQWIVVEVEDPVFVVRTRLQKCCWAHHRVGSDVVTEGLDFKSAPVEQARDIVRDAHIIRIDIQPTLDEQVAQSEIIGLHRGVVAARERARVVRF